MSVPPEFLNELRDRLAVSEIVGRRVRLQRKGREFQGLCPFHNEKTPSFTVNDDKGFYHCFGCGAHGDVITFAMNTEALSFPEAVEKLAQIAGLQVPAQHPEDRARDRKRRTLEEVMEAACLWYERNLRLPVGKQAVEYLKGRGLDEATLKRFRLGYAPNERSALKAHLVAEGFEEALIIEGGLHKPAEEAGDRPGGRSGERARGAIDYFRDRVIFPITDRRGRVIGFGGRVMGANGGGGQPKYLNSPETPLFHKGRVLYGLGTGIGMGAREAAGKAGSVLVTEGYMDVIGLAMGGFDYAVAPLGTALTEEQILQLWKLAPEPVLCFDGDAAGQRAAARAAERALPLLKPGFSLRFVTLPAKEDPDSLIRKQGPDAMRRLIDAAQPMVTALWRIERAKLQSETPEQLALLRQTLEEHAAKIADRTVQGFYRAALLRQMDDEFPMHPAKRPAAGGPARPAALAAAQAGAQAGPPPPELPIPAIGRRSRMLLGVLAVVVSRPALLQEHVETLASWDIGIPSIDRLRLAILERADSIGEDTPLASILDGEGFGPALENLSGQARRMGLGFIDPPQRPDHRLSLSEARRQLDAFLERQQQIAGLESELAHAARLLEQDMTEESWARFAGLQKALSALNDLETGPGAARVAERTA